MNRFTYRAFISLRRRHEEIFMVQERGRPNAPDYKEFLTGINGTEESLVKQKSYYRKETIHRVTVLTVTEGKGNCVCRHPGGHSVRLEA